eukprot:CAMPEP_0118966266 /NCGR_PEP_ID=MMETSP1173-20130426/3749_1 /TAXON_ID=1034831 /ORGANISM="Rhizochromulina marina cf, Strain CCMP1243" /LENGTH=445 /DNA_ID=CAMNT_0006915019 /DNA_START=33 /DNA_END=1370 /DNA_ORIENTATION=+
MAGTGSEGSRSPSPARARSDPCAVLALDIVELGGAAWEATVLGMHALVPSPRFAMLTLKLCPGPCCAAEVATHIHTEWVAVGALLWGSRAATCESSKRSVQSTLPRGWGRGGGWTTRVPSTVLQMAAVPATFSVAPAPSDAQTAGGGGQDLDNLDFQLLSDYLLEDGAPAFAGLSEGARGHSDDGGSDDNEGAKKRKTEPRQKTQAQIDRRRERNRILARRTRLRKKFFFESLQKQVAELQRENSVLKDIIKVNMKDVAGGILDKCTTTLPPIVTESRSKATELLNRSDFNLMQTLQSAQRSFCITDPSLPDNPIVFASQAFLDATGYSLDQVLGRNCRFLQGPETDRRKVEQIRKGIEQGVDTSVCLLNYRADGTTFWNQFFVAPLRDVNKRIVNYVGVQCVVDKPPPDDQEGEIVDPTQEDIFTGVAAMSSSSLPNEVDREAL